MTGATLKWHSEDGDGDVGDAAGAGCAGAGSCCRCPATTRWRVAAVAETSAGSADSGWRPPSSGACDSRQLAFSTRLDLAAGSMIADDDDGDD